MSKQIDLSQSIWDTRKDIAVINFRILRLFVVELICLVMTVHFYFTTQDTPEEVSYIIFGGMSLALAITIAVLHFGKRASLIKRAHELQVKATTESLKASQ